MNSSHSDRPIVAGGSIPPRSCPVCGATGRVDVLRLPELPVDLNSQVDPRQARSVTKGPTSLVVCTECGHLYNEVFDSALID